MTVTSDSHQQKNQEILFTLLTVLPVGVMLRQYTIPYN